MSVYCPRLNINTMRKVIFTALVALCATFQGEVCAHQGGSQPINVFLVDHSPITGTLQIQSAKLTEAQLEFVPNQVVQETGMTYSTARDQFATGKMTIGKLPGEYEVNYTRADGGIVTILIREGI